MDTISCWCTSRFHFRTPFLIYINDLNKDISSTGKLFADDTSIFSVVHDVNVSVMQLNNDLLKISKWSYQWKISFNPDVSKQAHKVHKAHFNHHIKEKITKASEGIRVIKKLSNILFF